MGKKAFRIPKNYSAQERMFWRIKEHLDSTNTTLEEEYKKIQNKESDLTKSHRDYVVLLVENQEEFKQILTQKE